ncbi:endo alpha-1,4 polygalactosaminidase [Streptantibioticus ferralitis]|uniref:Endo alpha-1,4 polygalactosaminidase n=1 Tax=Streptantibioticus ferralitis TaxID=236510 RepID=A0ABT5Z1B2_9ACTN|nr:endo alpha-1,4 polygalactosaminidase [Streptantibioticus ferralitis]MDF2257563.1 endo alpha-1,4 polygalactosaminidase [Streptantibioticus ferralitis]
MPGHASPFLRRKALVVGLTAGVVCAVGAGFALTDASAAMESPKPSARASRHSSPGLSAVTRAPGLGSSHAAGPTPVGTPSAPASKPGAGSPTAPAGAAGSGTPGKQVVPPTAHTTFDYQIGSPYRPASGVGAVSRDRAAGAVAGLYNVCYINAFQAQPDATAWWQSGHPGLLLRNDGGNPVMDQDWNEALLDVSTAAKRTQLAAIVGGWIDDCAAKGYQAVEPDNLDSYTRSDGRLTAGENAAFAQLLVQRAHADGLAIGQKNTADLLGQHGTIGFDFAVAEECGRYNECGKFADAYTNRVFVIEYDDADFHKSCSTWGDKLSVVLRDRDVTAPGSADYVFKTC